MNGLALCSGVGGLELGLHLALGEHYRTLVYVEREAYAAATLVARMEDATLDHAPVWDDLTTFDGRPWRGRVDIVSGGYPCQPFSVAGKRLGEHDERHLWPHVSRIVREVQPRYCFFENVANHLRLGFDAVEADLRSAGYHVEAGIFSAAELGASHRRERLFILAVADTCSERRQQELRGSYGDEGADEGRSSQDSYEPERGCQTVANTAGISEREPHDAERAESWQRVRQDAGGRSRELADASDGLIPQPGRGPQGRGGAGQAGEGLPAFPPGPGDDDGWRKWIAAGGPLPAVCRDAPGMAKELDCRNDRLRCCGNGVVPVVAAKAFITLAAKHCARVKQAEGVTV